MFSLKLYLKELAHFPNVIFLTTDHQPLTTELKIHPRNVPFGICEYNFKFFNLALPLRKVQKGNEVKIITINLFMRLNYGMSNSFNFFWILLRDLLDFDKVQDH